MKKIITLCLALSFLFSFNAQAQLPDGSVAPDFTATDLNGTEWTLSEILAEGKAVVMDVSATWCGPCWTYHQSGNLEDFYETYGPDGTDEVMVFMIEGDGTTSIDDLYGTGTNTLGDWVTGTTFPIIDSDAISSSYGVNAFPTMIHICPSGIMEARTGSFSYSNEELYTKSVECPESIGTNNAKLTDLAGLDGCLSGAAFITGTLQNVGSQNMTSAEVELTVNGVSEEIVPWTGDVATWGLASVTFAPIVVEPTDNLVVSINTVNGVDDEDTSDNTLTTSEVANFTQDVLEFFIHTDKWPEEITWQVKDESGTVIYENPVLECETDYTFSYDLTSYECYEFSIQDGFGDGLLNGQINPAAHSCTIGDEGATFGAISVGNSNGDVFWADREYGNGFDIQFINSAPVSTFDVEGLSNVSLYPNPVADQLNVEFSIAETSDLEVNIVNALGQTVRAINYATYGAGHNNLNINTANLANGVYFLTMSNGKQVTTNKFTVSK